MPTSTNVTNLKINELTEAQYDTAVQGGVIGPNELSVITDLDDAIQVSTMPTASADELGKVYQFIGTTGTYTHGYFYECVSDGGNPATYSWVQTNVQPAPTAPVTSVNTKTGAVVLDATDVGAIPQLSTLPTAAATNLGTVVQYIGADDAVAGLTHGYIYECTTDGSTYSWTQVSVQPQGSSLPSQTGQSGKFLTTNGTDASWSDKPLVNTATGANSLTILGTIITNQKSIGIGKLANCGSSNSVCIGYNSLCNVESVTLGAGAQSTDGDNICIGYASQARQYYSIALGAWSRAWSTKSIAIGYYAQIGNNLPGTMQFGTGTNTEAGTVKFSLTANNGSTYTNYTLFNNDGTIPTDRFTTTPSADGTYVPTLTISSGVATRSWTTPASAPVVPATMPTLAVADWSSNTQTVNVTGVTASNIVFVSPAPASASDYASAGIVCTAQGAGTLTFTCTTTPTNAITVNVVILG